jgi:hypothetical protein
MTKRYLLLALIAGAALGLNAAAQDEAPDAPAAPADEAPAPAEGRTPADESQAQADGQAQDSEDETEVEEEEFIFSEDIPADQQVTFPVDI